MKFIETPLEGVYVIEPELIQDDRGFFARSFCDTQFFERDLETYFPQANISYNHEIGTLRGMHYQAAPHQEIKLVRCTRGGIFDVIIDLRENSETYCQWFGVTLTAWNRKTLYVPEDFAHGYLTLEKNTEVFYQVSEPYNKQADRGVMYNDPEVGIKWPTDIKVVSERDLNHPPVKRIVFDE